MAEDTCSVVCGDERCGRPVLVKSRGWCSGHYQRWQTHGDLMADVPLRTFTKLGWPDNLLRRLRFDPPTTMPTGCIVWTGPLNSSGYGGVWTGENIEPAHRAAWIMVRGPIPDGLHVDHLCRNRACCNTGHMEPVTPRENNMRSDSPAALASRKTHCPAGHPYEGANLIVRRNSRECRECKNARRRKARRDRRSY